MPTNARRLFLFAAAAGLALALGVIFARLLARPEFYTYDWRVYYLAAGDLLSGTSPYATLVGGPTDPVYLYPPVFAALLIPLLPLGLALSSALVVVLAIVLPPWLLLRERLSPPTLPDGIFARRPIRAAALVVIGITFGSFAIWWPPAYHGAIEGSVSLLLGLLLVASTRWADRRPWWSGVPLGLAVAIKLTPALLLPVLLSRRSWRAVVVALATMGLLALLSLLPPGGLPAWDDFAGTLGATAQAALGGYGDQNVTPMVAAGLAKNAAPLALAVRFGLLEREAAIGLARLLPLLAIPCAVLLDRLAGGGQRGTALVLILSLLVVPTLWPHAALLLLPLLAPTLMGTSVHLPRAAGHLPAPWPGIVLLLAATVADRFGMPAMTLLALVTLLPALWRLPTGERR